MREEGDILERESLKVEENGEGEKSRSYGRGVRMSKKGKKILI